MSDSSLDRKRLSPEDPEAWERFLEFHRSQLKELCTRYSPDLLWFAAFGP